MFKCKKCKSIYLNEKEALKCSNKIKEKPLIELGRILIDTPYLNIECEIRCFAIKLSGHFLTYYFDWQDKLNGGEWCFYQTIHSNECLIDNYANQL